LSRHKKLICEHSPLQTQFFQEMTSRTMCLILLGFMLVPPIRGSRYRLDKVSERVSQSHGIGQERMNVSGSSSELQGSKMYGAPKEIEIKLEGDDTCISSGGPYTMLIRNSVGRSSGGAGRAASCARFKIEGKPEETRFESLDVPGQCIDVFGSLFGSKDLGLWNCKNSANQMFTAQGDKWCCDGLCIENAETDDGDGTTTSTTSQPSVVGTKRPETSRTSTTLKQPSIWTKKIHAVGTADSDQSAQGSLHTCSGAAFEIITGNTVADTKRIAQGLHEWISRIRSGTWGTWLQQRLATVEKTWRQGIRDARLALDGSQEDSAGTSPQVFEAWKLLKIVFLQYFPELVIGAVVVTQSIPELIASFSGGKLQSVGKLYFTEDESHVYFPLAVTRYTISYTVKAIEQAERGAGKVLLSGWLEDKMVDLEDNLVMNTFPASAFVRQHYIKNGAANACDETKTDTNAKCDAMLQKKEKENCDCDVKICVKLKCLYFFQAGMCGTATTWDMALGVKKGCYGVSGDFTGSCPI